MTILRRLKKWWAKRNASPPPDPVWHLHEWKGKLSE